MVVFVLAARMFFFKYAYTRSKPFFGWPVQVG